MQCLKLHIILIFSIVGGLSLHSNASTAYTNFSPDSTVVALKDTTKKVNEQVEQIIQFAKKFLGTPYHYAGSTPSGFDCSGFIYYVMGNFGMRLSRSSPGLAEYGKTVKLAELQPGDLMFFKGRNLNTSSVGHVAMVVEVKDGIIKFIHSSTSRGVIIDTFNNSRYYVPRYLKSKRLDYGGAKVK
jgi:cell wall-associated NlpC family hydrolase